MNARTKILLDLALAIRESDDTLDVHNLQQQQQQQPSTSTNNTSKTIVSLQN